MNGFEAALLGWGVFCTALLILALGCLDDIRRELRAEKALRQAQTRVLVSGDDIDAEEITRALERSARRKGLL